MIATLRLSRIKPARAALKALAFQLSAPMPIKPHSPHHPHRESSHAVEAENLKPGDPPTPPTTPEGSEASSRSSKTRTDPNTGAPTPGRPDTVGG
jgi:hypothetical protein